MAELKTKPTTLSVADYLAGIADEQKREDCRVLVELFTDVTGFDPVLWGNSMVGFGSYHYKSERSAQQGDWPLTAFAARAAGITIYCMPGLEGYTAELEKLGPHKISGGSCLYLKRLKGIDLTVLKEIVASSVVTMKKNHC